MAGHLKPFDVVALVEDRVDIALARGQVGTIVEVLALGVYEVEFSDEDGRAYAFTAATESQLLLLRFRSQSL